MTKDVGEFQGLNQLEVNARRERDGFNELPASMHRNTFRMLLEILSEPMVYLLLGCGIIYLILGDQTEALSLLAFLVLILFITVYQESKAERALEALKDLSSPRALVIRDGKKIRIPGRDLVLDDLVVLSEGDRVPADGALLSCNNLAADESLLTGESLPVDKLSVQGTSSDSLARPSLLDATKVYSGTTIVRGAALMKVSAIGSKTELGKIGKSLSQSKAEQSFLQSETRSLVKKLAWVSLALCVLVVALYGLSRGSWLDGFLAGLALAMAILPNELPAVLVIFLALGAWRLSKKRVLTRHISAVETLGSATIICVDKTGTLTLNKMQIERLFVRDQWLDMRTHKGDLPESFHELLEYGILASRREPFDPMEKAIQQSSIEYLAKTEHLHPDWSLLREYPLTQELLAVSQVWTSKQGEGYRVGAKGAPEAIADLCHLSAEDRVNLSAKVRDMAQEGLRVIGVARAHSVDGSLPKIQHDFAFEFLGLIGLADPVRPGVSETVQECYSAGIRILMITGDHRETAKSIARQIGLRDPDLVLTGEELKAMSDDELQKHLKQVNIFSRMAPEQKLRLVNALKTKGEVVAMTGDGVNDAPALKAAHIGIAMGSRGTDVARESASLVLLDDDFQAIVEAIRGGRRIYANLRNAMSYLLAVHIPIAGISLLPVLMGLPLVLLPIHIAFLHLIIEPASSIFFEAEAGEPDLMKQPPRDPRARLFSKQLLLPCLLQGTFVLLMVSMVFLVSIYRGQGELEARALAFTTLIVANLGLILSRRNWKDTFFEIFRSNPDNPSLRWIFWGSLILLGLVLYVPALREIFRFSVLHSVDLLVCLGAAVFSILWFEIRRVVTRKST